MNEQTNIAAVPSGDAADQRVREIEAPMLFAESCNQCGKFLGHVADAMAEEGAIACEPGDIRFRLVDRFDWIDDGEGVAHLNILTSVEADAVAAAGSSSRDALTKGASE